MSQAKLSFFDTLGLNADFLTQEDPDRWPIIDIDSEDVCQQSDTGKWSSRVNCELMQDFNSSITTSEEQKQFLLQVVSIHRTKYPEARKSVLVSNQILKMENLET